MSVTVQPSDTIRSLIDRRASEQGNAPFLIDAETSIQCNYEQLRILCIRVAESVAATGVNPGSSVAYAMNNGLAAAITVLGLQYGGYRAVSINLVAGPEVIGYVLSHSETELVVAQTATVEEVERGLTCAGFLEGKRAQPLKFTLDTVSGNDLLFQWQAVGSASPTVFGVQPTVKTAPKSVAVSENIRDITPASDGLLMYTSGTTGRPKGVVLSHENILAGGANVCVGHELTQADRALCVLPLFHINGLCVTLIGPLVAAGSVVMPARFSTSKFWDWIEQHQCTWFSVVPTQISYLLRDAGESKHLPNLRFGRSASAPLSPDVHGAFEKRFKVPLIETMGLTETAAQILSNPMPPTKRKLGSPGLPVGVELRVIGADGKDVQVGSQGELWVRGNNVMQRYFHNVEATNSALTPDAWLKTGDLGNVDGDGYVYITGRLKELIIKGGENIAPREIDDALYSHPDVVEAAAFAVTCHDYGQRVEAAVCLKPGSTINASDLLAIVRGAVGAFKCPDKIHLLEELPKGPSGKIQRNKLCDMSLV